MGVRALVIGVGLAVVAAVVAAMVTPPRLAIPRPSAGEGIEPKIPGMDELIHTSTVAFLDHHVLGDAA
ncbi:MAG: hypothetical protein OES57_13790, partial [Acidimicrobiia bacterium]|nr:hypothetical protein [Acidimicrobiia bacterium]